MKDTPCRHQNSKNAGCSGTRTEKFLNLVEFCTDKQDEKNHAHNAGTLMWVLRGLWAGL